MTCIADFIDRTPLIHQGATVGDVAERFAAFAGVHVFPVSDGQRIVGLIHRSTIEMALRAGHGASGVRHLATIDPIVVDGGADVRDVLETALRDTGRRSDGVAVTEGGQYLGMAALDRALKAILQGAGAQASSPRLDEQVREEVSCVIRAAELEFRGQVDGLMAMVDRLDRQHLTADARTQVQSIKAIGETLLRIGADTVDMMMARQGRLALNPSPQRLRELIDAVQERWVGRAGDIGVSLLISYDGDPDLSAVIDPHRLMQVFDNLIDGALRYTRQGSVEVSLRARTEGEQVLLEGRVRDTGQGLASARLAQIVDADGVPSGQDGSLALSLTHGIVQNMNGAIRAESNPGQGITIVFDMAAPVATPVAAAPTTQLSPVNGTPHILVVDDNATNRMVAEALCEMFDCTSETAEDGLEAVEAARSGRFDLILMDIKMPRMDGIAATHAIHALGGQIGAVPIIALTANADAEDARAYLAAGMCAVVEKPIKPDRLLQAINAALANSGAPVAAAQVAAA
jgi:CheY-like chemotaxis protein